MATFFNQDLYIKVLKARGYFNQNHSADNLLKASPMLGRLVLDTQDCQIGIIESAKLCWCAGYYILYVVRFGNSHGTMCLHPWCVYDDNIYEMIKHSEASFKILSLRLEDIMSSTNTDEVKAKIEEITASLKEASEHARSFQIQSDSEMAEYWEQKCEELENELRSLTH